MSDRRDSRKHDPRTDTSRLDTSRLASTRREFFIRCLPAGVAAAGGLGAALGGGPSAGTDPAAAKAAPPAAAGGGKKSLLILGGTNFIGPHIVDAARARGLAVAIFTRGKRNPDLFPEGVEKLRGDRDPQVGEGLKALEGRRFDAVIDTSGHVPRHVRASAKLLAPNAARYIFVSSLSAYASHDTPGADEDAPLAPLEKETEDFQGVAFGPLKALCEKAVQEEFAGRAAVVRPGLIVGPRDNSDRFGYWPVRVARGGEVLAPGTPDDPVMIIDARDLAEWLVKLAVDGTTGVFNAIGPDRPLTMGQMLAACREAAGSDARFTWVDAAFLEQQKVRPWSDMPVWMPPEGEMAGFHRRSIARALKAGLTFRPLVTTCRDTLAWYATLPPERRQMLRSGLVAGREADVLAAWHARAATPPAS